LVVLALAGCGGESAPPIDMAAPAAFCVEGTPVAPTFDNIARLLALHCISCHEGTDVDLTRDHVIPTLIRRAVPSYEQIDESCGGLLVVPGDAGVSYLHQKVTSRQPCAGVQMPRTEFGDGTALLPCEQQLVTDWINAGAPGP
jgi:hypothetical protein